MTNLLDRLNLRPQERRWVVMAVAILAVVLHFWFVQPLFKQWGQTKTTLLNARETLAKYQSAVTQTEEYQKKLGKLEGQTGTGLLNPEQAGNLLIQRVSAQARESKVNYSGINVLRNASKPNEFFEEQTLHLGVNPTGDKEMVDFLVAIGNSDLMVRVKELNLNPDQGGYKLMGSMNLVASFQKKGAIGPATVKPAAGLSSTRP